MREFLWLNHLPGGALEKGVALANRMYWNLTWAGNDQRWCVWSGEKLILRSDSREVVEAFLYGMGLAYAVLPDEVFNELERGAKALVAPDDLEEG